MSVSQIKSVKPEKSNERRFEEGYKASVLGTEKLADDEIFARRVRCCIRYWNISVQKRLLTSLTGNIVELNSSNFKLFAIATNY